MIHNNVNLIFPLFRPRVWTVEYNGTLYNPLTARRTEALLNTETHSLAGARVGESHSLEWRKKCKNQLNNEIDFQTTMKPTFFVALESRITNAKLKVARPSPVAAASGQKRALMMRFPFCPQPCSSSIQC